jgi:hypothetical protein
VDEQSGQVPPREQRRAARFSIEVPMEYQDHSLGGRGLTANLSVSGVRIEQASQRVPIGMQLTLRFSFFQGSFGSLFRGEVVRHSEDGFAVTFGSLDDTQIDTLRRILPSAAYA